MKPLSLLFSHSDCGVSRVKIYANKWKLLEEENSSTELDRTNNFFYIGWNNILHSAVQGSVKITAFALYETNYY